jgi:hypothetical protein
MFVPFANFFHFFLDKADKVRFTGIKDGEEEFLKNDGQKFSELV